MAPQVPRPIEVFEHNIADAQRLLDLASPLTNTRARSMRKELRAAVGEALGIGVKQREHLDCVESADVFVVLKPGASFTRTHFTEVELRPLLRQTVVAISAAVETYVADVAITEISGALKLQPRPARLREISVNLVEVLEIDSKYTRRGWGTGTSWRRTSATRQARRARSGSYCRPSARELTGSSGPSRAWGVVSGV